MRGADGGPERPGADRSNLARGRWGERLAAAHYERLGYEVVDRNWRSKTGELDLVLLAGAAPEPIYVFSEVKARRTDRFGAPATAVGPAKQRRIRRLALEWLDAHGLAGVDVRFDVVAITGTAVKVYEAAF
jgi:putative endonuclease